MMAARNTNFFKRLRMFICALAVGGAFSCPLRAQGLTPAQFIMFPPSVSMSARPMPAVVMPGARPISPIVAATVPFRNTTVWRPSGSYHHDQHNSPIENAVEISETPFGQQYRMTIGSLFGGRVLLGGFGNVTPMENILRGLPGSGSLIALSSTPMGRAGLKTPKDDRSYGLTLTLHRARNAEGALGANLVRCLGRLVGRGCR
jgi:hypothetical protein